MARPFPGKQGRLFETPEYLEYKAERKRLGLGKKTDDEKDDDVGA